MGPEQIMMLTKAVQAVHPEQFKGTELPLELPVELIISLDAQSGDGSLVKSDSGSKPDSKKQENKPNGKNLNKN